MSRRPRQGALFSPRRYSAADLLLAVSLLAACAAVVTMLPEKEKGELLQGRARAVDGDSVRLNGVEIRLAGLDAPELRQTCERNGQSWNCGEAARSFLATRLGRADASCRSQGIDRYGRTLAVCSVAGEDINAALVRDGMAVSYGDYGREEAEARAARRGVWAGQFMTPQEWRRLHPRRDRNP
ncbi:hypothetical protein GCM10019059_28940 [Camelimonas fluminis]|uniref:Thermonuclease family protein n=1 Tax=Camelimonas fluminis TaxID=1576911 RepID=A0ABV7UFH7_9HYPH|nr:thermonuclease family protein [Camelimonas fluminis]GHE67357.1 hypothetical protein GCM10019059_28940 [Camelimonas fluminis]